MYTTRWVFFPPASAVGSEHGEGLRTVIELEKREGNQVEGPGAKGVFRSRRAGTDRPGGGEGDSGLAGL